MKTKYTMALSLLAGVAIGGLAVHSLHAQGAKTAYSVSELNIKSLDAEKAYVGKARDAIGKSGGKPLRTTGGKIERIEGGAAPVTVAIVEWPSAKAAKDFYTSPGWTSLQAERDKAYDVIRRYVVETE